MISPVLDFAWFDGDTNPMVYVTHLPSLAAAARDLTGLDPRKHLADVEAYAAGPYIVDLLRGERDPEALARVSAKVALSPVSIRRWCASSAAVSIPPPSRANAIARAARSAASMMR